MLTFEKIDGLTNEEVIARFGSLTNGPIMCADLENWMDDSNLAKRNPITGAWEGSLIDALSSGGPLGDGLSKLFSHLNKPRSVTVDCHREEWAVLMGQLLGGLQLASLITPEQAAEVTGLAGGLRHDGLNEEYIDGIRQDHADMLAEQQQKQEDAEFFRQVLELNARFNDLREVHVNPLIESRELNRQLWSDAIGRMAEDFVEPDSDEPVA